MHSFVDHTWGPEDLLQGHFCLRCPPVLKATGARPTPCGQDSQVRPQPGRQQEAGPATLQEGGAVHKILRPRLETFGANE